MLIIILISTIHATPHTDFMRMKAGDCIVRRQRRIVRRTLVIEFRYEDAGRVWKKSEDTGL